MNKASYAGRREQQENGPILVTDTFVQQVGDIYGHFSAGDAEYPTLGVVIQGSSAFIRCVQLPDVAIERRQMTDYMHMEHPEAQRVWKQQLVAHGGRVRFSTTHIHPMNYESLSSYDKAQFEKVRTSPDTLNPYDVNHAMPVILINLTEDSLDLHGFWICDGKATAAPVVNVADNDERVMQAFDAAEPLAFFSSEARICESANRNVKKSWSVELASHRRTNQRAMRGARADGKRVMLRFSPSAPFGISCRLMEMGQLDFASYVDWSRLLDDLVTGEEVDDKAKGTTTGDMRGFVADDKSETPTRKTDEGKGTESPREGSAGKAGRE